MGAQIRNNRLKWFTLGVLGLALGLLIFVGMLSRNGIGTWADSPGMVRASGAPETPETLTVEKQWYSGGTLHDSTMGQWRSASEADRLATAADWLMDRLLAAGVAPGEAPGGLDAWRATAQAMADGVTAAGVDGSIDRLPAEAVADTVWEILAQRALARASR